MTPHRDPRKPFPRVRGNPFIQLGFEPGASPLTHCEETLSGDLVVNLNLNLNTTEPNLNQTKPSLSISPVLHSRLSLVKCFGCVAGSTHLCNVREGSEA